MAAYQVYNVMISYQPHLLACWANLNFSEWLMGQFVSSHLQRSSCMV